VRHVVHARAALFGRIAPLLAILSLAACGHDGGSSPLPPIPSKLFAADSGNHVIVSFINSNPSGPGAVPANRLITGADTSFATSNIPAMTLDVGRDLLYVSNGPQVIVFAGASTANGDASPARTPATASAGNFSSLYIDTANDRLYVGETFGGGVSVYDNASTLNLATPNRTLIPDFGTGFQVRGVAVDVVNDILYVAGSTSSSTSILAFNGASAISGIQPPNRAIALPLSSDISILLDAANDRLYVSDSGGNISVLDNASTQDVTAVVARAFSLGSALMTKLALDPVNDRLYLAAHSSLIIVPGINAAPGGSLPAGTYQLVAPTAGDVTAVAVTP